jgi:cytochrome b561
MQTLRYNLAHRLLHWFIALLVFGLLAIGSLLGTLGYDGVKDLVGSEMTNQLYGYHKTFGIVLLMLMVIRLALRRLFRPPAYQPALNGFERAASLAVHSLFYIALIVMPVLGWLATASGGFPVQFFNLTLPGLISENKELSKTLFELHALVGWVILGLIVLHVSAAVYHWKIKRDGVMGRMSLF